MNQDQRQKSFEAWGKTAPVITPFAAWKAALESPEVQALRRLAKALEEKIESYERYGPICVFEGDAMIHALHLYELREAMEKQK